MCVGVCVEEHDEWTQLKTRVSGPALTLTLAIQKWSLLLSLGI